MSVELVARLKVPEERTGYVKTYLDQQPEVQRLIETEGEYPLLAIITATSPEKMEDFIRHVLYRQHLTFEDGTLVAVGTFQDLSSPAEEPSAE